MISTITKLTNEFFFDQTLDFVQIISCPTRGQSTLSHMCAQRRQQGREQGRQLGALRDSTTPTSTPVTKIITVGTAHTFPVSGLLLCAAASPILTKGLNCWSSCARVCTRSRAVCCSVRRVHAAWRPRQSVHVMPVRCLAPATGLALRRRRLSLHLKVDLLSCFQV